jgi:tRNA nucleotidyltransferase (CCA-adding enzyme)
MAPEREIQPERLPEDLGTLHGLELVRSATAEVPAYLVGGIVRDLLLGRPRTDIDVAVEADIRPIAEALGGDVIEHERFATASVRLDGLQVDLARARAETYEHPGALPKVTPATIADDLGRRDFTINAMAVPLTGEPELLDPHGGVDDLKAGLLRVLHDRSFIDDPTRALRAARYAARFDLELEPKTAKLLRKAGLGTVSADRVEAELRKIGAEENPARALELVGAWGILPLPADAIELTTAIVELTADPPWVGFIDASDAIVVASGHGATSGPERRAAEKLARATPERPSQGVRAVKGFSPVELLLARAMGAEWLDRYVGEWSKVSLEIDGADLLKKIPEGPAIGRGLEAALSAKLDGEISSRDDELRIALAAAKGEIPEG